jgi:hypothetical protein
LSFYSEGTDKSNAAEETKDEVSDDDEGEQSDEDDEAAFRDTNRGKKELWALEEDDKDGRAIVPTFDHSVRLPDIKDIIRALVTHAYREILSVFIFKTYLTLNDPKQRPILQQ